MNKDMRFESAEADRLWRDFLRRLDWANRDLSNEERLEARTETAGHIQDAMEAMQHGDELNRLTTAIEDFGELVSPPPRWLKPIAVVLHYLSIMFIGVIGLFLLALAHMCVMEVLHSDSVGLWLYPDDGLTLSYEVQPGATEILGAWFIPTALACIAVLGGTLWTLWRVAVSSDGRIPRWIRGD